MLIGLPKGRSSLHFADRFAGIDRLDERIFSLKVKDAHGRILPPEIRGGGLYLIESPGGEITIIYEMRLARVLDPTQSALVSSLGPDAAVLMLGDLLPWLCPDGDVDCHRAPLRIQITVPAGWMVATTEKAHAGVYQVDDPQRAVIFIGGFRERSAKVRSMNIRFAVTGTWSFSDDEIFELAESIARKQADFIDSREAADFLATFAPFPLPLTGLRSSALTVGRTVILQLNPNKDPAQTFAHLRRHLAHEMFHFYLPNAFRVRENFDWFWEGFTRYVALLTLTSLQNIGLNEYFDAIAEEFESYAINPLRTQVSLLSASPEKFSNNPSYDLVYRKGMLVAALYDLELRWQSRGKHNVTDVVRALYQNYAGRGLDVGNREVLGELSRRGDFKRMIRDDIEGTKEIEIAARIRTYGLVVELGPATGGKVKIKRAAQLSGRQREFFDQLLK